MTSAKNGSLDTPLGTCTSREKKIEVDHEHTERAFRLLSESAVTAVLKEGQPRVQYPDDRSGRASQD